MLKRRRNLLAIILVVLILIGAYVWARCACPPEGIAFTAERRALHRLKNRTHFPAANDFDPNVTLERLLQPGDDHGRWSTARAARLEGYVVALNSAKVELANCYLRRDIHIDIGLQKDSPAHQRVVLEVTPRLHDWARTQGQDWSEANLHKTLMGRWCSFEGWLFFDLAHSGEAENTAPGRPGNWRATAWEIHPLMKFSCVEK